MKFIIWGWKALLVDCWWETLMDWGWKAQLDRLGVHLSSILKWMELQTRGISSIAKWARPIMTKISTTGKATGFIICNHFCAVKKRLFNNVRPKGCGINEKRNGFGPVAYAGFSKGEARKFEINEDQNENFPAQNQVRFFCPKLGED